MHKNRLEAFSDGVIAIIITLMALEMKIPHGYNWAALRPMLPVFLSYVLSFINVGIYWNNHHHLFQAVNHINGRVLWANLHLLFWLSLIPFVTGWIGENHFPKLPVAVYAFVLMMCGIAYYILVRSLVSIPDKNQELTEAIGNDRKGIVSVILYLLAIPLAFINSWVAILFVALVASIWLIPDRRIEKKIVEE